MATQTRGFLHLVDQQLNIIHLPWYEWRFCFLRGLKPSYQSIKLKNSCKKYKPRAAPIAHCNLSWWASTVEKSHPGLVKWKWLSKWSIMRIFFYRKLKIKVIFFSLPAIIEVSALFELNEDPSWCPIWPRERCPRPSNHWTEPPKITQVNYVDEAYLAAEEFLWCNWHTHAMGPNVQVDRQDYKDLELC